MKRITVLVGLMTVSCLGTLQLEENESDNRDDDSVVVSNDDPVDDSEIEDPTEQTDPSDPDPTDPDPIEDPLEEPSPPQLTVGTIGTRCVDGQIIEYLVLSKEGSTCETDLTNIDQFNRGKRLLNTVVLPLNGESEIQERVEYCESASSVMFGSPCLNLEVNIDVEAGVWTGMIDGEEHTVNFTQSECDYDAIAPPDWDVPAHNISIAEASIYQGVQIPFIEQGAPISANRNSPIVANRPGLIRVFVQPEAGWSPREIIARLTIGDVTKEIPFTPTGPSTEADYASTINFELFQNELAANIEYSLELIETDGAIKTAVHSCVDIDETIATARVPGMGTLPMESEGLNAPMKIVIVPVRYDGDGSGRLPSIDAAAVQRFRDKAFTHFPVHDIDISVRAAIPYSGTVTSNLAGWGALLDFCRAQRTNDNVARETYYYCVVQPASTSFGYCSTNCIGGLGTVPNAFQFEYRASVGLSFNGNGEDVFIHEVGHNLGRNHSPCGGPGNLQQGYPYPEGLIGSTGYNVLSGEFVDASTTTDFMGYCGKEWVSDFTYGAIFERLQSDNTAARQVATVPKRWKTAIRDIDGVLKWGHDIDLTTLPTGDAISADLFDSQGNWIESPNVTFVSVADADVLLLTIEDTGVSGGTISIDDVGDLTIP